MSKLGSKLGKLTFLVAWPIWFVYFKATTRTRVLIICGEQVLLVKGWIGGQKWSLPGGGLHRDEEPTVGAIREVFEETGIRLQNKQLKHMGISSTTEHGLKLTYHCYFVNLDKKINTKRQKLEISKIEWLNISTLDVNNSELDTLDVLGIWRGTSVSDTM